MFLFIVSEGMGMYITLKAMWDQKINKSSDDSFQNDVTYSSH